MSPDIVFALKHNSGVFNKTVISHSNITSAKSYVLNSIVKFDV